MNNISNILPSVIPAQRPAQHEDIVLHDNPTSLPLSEEDRTGKTASQSLLSPREKAIARVLTLVRAAYERDPLKGAEKKIKEAVWSDALREVPTDQLVALARAELGDRTSKFMPAPADLLRRFRGEEETTDGQGRVTRHVRANVDCYRPYEQIKAEWDEQRSRMLEAPLPTLEITPDELKRRLRSSDTPARAAALRPGRGDVWEHGVGDESERVSPTPRPESADEGAWRLGVLLSNHEPIRLSYWTGFWRWWHGENPGGKMLQEHVSDPMRGFEAYCAHKRSRQAGQQNAPLSIEPQQPISGAEIQAHVATNVV